MVESIIKEMDVDPCAEQETEDLGAPGLFDLSRALVHMKELQDKCVVEEGVISHLRKCNETLANEQDQYKDALCTLNKEVTELNEKLKEETCHREKEQEAKATLEKELTALLEQVETAKVDAMNEFKASQPFIDSCAIYYGDWFEDCLKQVKFVYLHLDLSKVTMDNPLLSTPIGDSILRETDDSTHLEPDPKNDGVVLAQLAVEKPDTYLIPSTEGQDAENPST
ncbi:hypothetical protein SO802_023852 [Lithocarpus litseifolius]|uniref:Uncharacterized protein n=1 Tax=Lithocarpus litseifolius TaxID=425828 RepID=A0AAW2C7H4_9ROSI